MNYIMISNIIYCVLAAIFGTVIGSFMNVVIYRIPEGRTIVKGHSMCMSCGHELGALDLVPVFSWLFLGGKCRYCKAPVSSRYIKIETFTGLTFLIYAITHTSFFPDILNPTESWAIAGLIYICVISILMATLIGSMMIYHDTRKSFYGFTIVSACAALITTIAFCIVDNVSGQLFHLLRSALIAPAIVGVIALICLIFKKKYTQTDFWLDLPFAFFYSYFGKSIIDYKLVVPASVLLLVLPRIITKDSKKDKYTAIVSMVGILIFIIVGFIFNKFFK